MFTYFFKRLSQYWGNYSQLYKNSLKCMTARNVCGGAHTWNIIINKSSFWLTTIRNIGHQLYCSSAL